MSEDEEADIHNFCSCSDHRLSKPETDPLFLAVHDNDLRRLKSLLKSGKNPNTTGRRGFTLLTYAIQLKKVEIFDYLLSLKGVNIDAVDVNGQSPLFIAFTLFDQYCITRLIKKGANIHLKDDKGFTLLHLGAWNVSRDTSNIGRDLIEKGVDVNEKNNYGETPIYIACSVGNIHWIHMLLYYAADVSITSDLGILPLAALVEFTPDDPVREILFNFTFQEETTMALPTMVKLMSRRSNMFDQVLSLTSEVVYNRHDLNFFAKHLLRLRAGHFQSFMQKFGHIVKDLTENYPVLSSLVEMGAITKNPEQKGLISAFLYSPYVFEFVQSRELLCPVIAKLMQMFSKAEEEAEVTEIACVMLSYGLEVTSFDLDVVYSYRGCCELFRLLLHMDVILMERGKCVMATLYYDFSKEMECLLDEMLLSPEVFGYFNLQKLKTRCSRSTINKDVAAKVRALPSVSSLVELSRNVARGFIVKRYAVRRAVEFYTVLNGLPIDKMTRSILALEKQLY